MLASRKIRENYGDIFRCEPFTKILRNRKINVLSVWFEYEHFIYTLHIQLKNVSDLNAIIWPK